jgi:hypothetical protein
MTRSHSLAGQPQVLRGWSNILTPLLEDATTLVDGHRPRAPGWARKGLKS